MLNEDDILEQFTKKEDILKIFNLIADHKNNGAPQFPKAFFINKKVKCFCSP